MKLETKSIVRLAETSSEMAETSSELEGTSSEISSKRSETGRDISELTGTASEISSKIGSKRGRDIKRTGRDIRGKLAVKSIVAETT